jgi:hypothetical protein
MGSKRDLVKQLSAIMGVKLRPMRKKISKMVDEIFALRVAAEEQAAGAETAVDSDEPVAAGAGGAQQDMASAAAAGDRRRNLREGQDEGQDWGSGLEGAAREGAGLGSQGGEEVQGQLTAVVEKGVGGDEGNGDDMDEEGWGSGADERAADDHAMVEVEDAAVGGAAGGSGGETGPGGDEVEDSIMEDQQEELLAAVAMHSGSGRARGVLRRLVVQESDSEECGQTPSPPATVAAVAVKSDQQCQLSTSGLAGGGAGATAAYGSAGAQSAVKKAAGAAAAGSHSSTPAADVPSTIKKRLVSSKAAAANGAAASRSSGEGGSQKAPTAAAAAAGSPKESHPAAELAGACADSRGSGENAVVARGSAAKVEEPGGEQTNSSTGTRQQQQQEEKEKPLQTKAAGGGAAGGVDLDALIAAKLEAVLGQQQQEMQRKLQQEMEKRLQEEMERKLQEQLGVERARHAAEREQLEQRLQELMGKLGEGGSGCGAQAEVGNQGRQQHKGAKEEVVDELGQDVAAAGDSPRESSRAGGAEGRDGCDKGVFHVPAAVAPPAVTPGAGGKGGGCTKKGGRVGAEAGGAAAGAGDDGGCGFKGFVTPAPVRNGPGSRMGELGGPGVTMSSSTSSGGGAGGLDEVHTAVAEGRGLAAAGGEGDVALSPLMVGYLITPPPEEGGMGHQVTPGTTVMRSAGPGGFAARVLEAKEEEQLMQCGSPVTDDGGAAGGGEGNAIEVTTDAVQEWLQQHEAGATGPVLLKAFGGSRAAAALGAVLQELVDSVDVLRKGGSAANSGAVDLADLETVYVAL